MKQAISEAKAGDDNPAPGAFEARLLPFAEVWNRIHSRSPSGGHTAKAEKSRGKTETTKEKTTDKADKSGEKHPNAAKAASTVRDLHLSKLAVQAFEKGHDTVSGALSGKGDTFTITGEFEEGTLRFVGKALSQFVKDNLED
jgi:hypothetical protein